MTDPNASGAKSADGVEGPRTPAMANAGPGNVVPETQRKAKGSGKRVSKTRRAGQGRPTSRNKNGNKKRAKRRAKADAPLVDNLGRTFPPAPTDLKAGPGGKVFHDKAGRPYAIKDAAHAVSTLEGLGAIMATSKECAAVLKISEPTLFAFFKRVPEAREAWEGGKLQGRASLRRTQFKLAERNATMGIFLGMNYLDQRDKRAFSGDPANPIKHQHSGAVKATVEHDYSNIPLDDLVRLHAEGVAGKKGSD